MKTCNQCGECKPYSDFARHQETRDGYRSGCKRCRSADLRAWREKNKAAVAEKAKAYYESRMRPWFQARYIDQKPAYQARRLEWLAKHPDKHSATQARRRASKLQRTPAWADRQAIAAVYAEAAAIRALGVDCHVDHVVPLAGTNVSGFHVANNLQIVLATDNLAKGNRHTW